MLTVQNYLNQISPIQKVVAHKPRGYVKNVLTSQIKVFGESREAFFQKGSLAAGGSVADKKSVADTPTVKLYR
ncbi:hypothetical protein [Halodesulfovibrio sp. MK-HDV]|uniref:hypothetical protein n=1 Tax=Halodesulfovibrio sp. MK-HDV TaxID=2599925 RepID=UPI001C20B036|nr:hypothetical protein [Halodesulfovibrio sp. MK-HDV]